MSVEELEKFFHIKTDGDRNRCIMLMSKKPYFGEYILYCLDLAAEIGISEEEFYREFSYKAILDLAYTMMKYIVDIEEDNYRVKH